MNDLYDYDCDWEVERLIYHDTPFAYDPPLFECPVCGTYTEEDICPACGFTI